MKDLHSHVTQVCKQDKKTKRVKVKALKRLHSEGRSNETLGDTTVQMLKQSRYVCSLGVATPLTRS